ncbi:hypothetical protein ABEB36_012884 [Hypothenemus hampei]|uniref:CCHC-type domain-containing protein n=1 Tax=Hypothenemus hampei TaxID=57062 RepID=A0ABD1E8U2_HYPHA
MALNTLLTGLEPRIGHIVRASNPRDLLEAQIRIRRELQLSYFETQKLNKQIPVRTQTQPANNKRPNFQPKCHSCGRIGHLANECRSQQKSNFPQISQRPNFNSQGQSFQQNRPNEQRPHFAPHNTNQQSNNSQQRPSVIQRNPDFQQNKFRTYHISSNHNDEPENIQELTDNNEFHYYDNNGYNDLQEYDSFDETNYQDFLNLSNQNHPPDSQTDREQISSETMSQILDQVQTLNLDDMDPSLNFPEQKFL